MHFYVCVFVFENSVNVLLIWKCVDACKNHLWSEAHMKNKQSTAEASRKIVLKQVHVEPLFL